MYKFCRHPMVLYFACAMVLLSGMAFPQVSQTPRSDMFASVHMMLSDAADKTLALALADRTWMKAQSDASSSKDVIAANAVSKAGRLRAGVQRVRQLQPIIEPILQQEGIPSELSAIVLVESGGLTTARSSKGALGLWQLMPDTARRYGLVVSASQDDRLDIVESTRAAARYLRDLYHDFADWELVFAAYNAGQKAVGQAIDRVGNRNFVSLERVLPAETRNYVPAIVAAIRELHSQEFGSSSHIFYASAETGN